jgi:hypothetical protein
MLPLMLLVGFVLLCVWLQRQSGGTSAGRRSFADGGGSSSDGAGSGADCGDGGGGDCGGGDGGGGGGD